MKRWWPLLRNDQDHVCARPAVSTVPAAGSLIDPVNLLEWNSDGRCVLLDLSAFLAIAAHISKHAISEDDHVIISYGEVRIPATLAKQSLGK